MRVGSVGAGACVDVGVGVVRWWAGHRIGEDGIGWLVGWWVRRQRAQSSRLLLLIFIEAALLAGRWNL